MTPAIQSLLTVANAFCDATNSKLGGVSKRIFNDGKTFDNLAKGADMLIGRHDMAMQWLSDNWPEDAVWPVDVARPPKTEAAA